MFERWGFLLTEIFALLAIAALLGLFVGWLIWGRRSEVAIDTSEADRLRAELTACTARSKDMAGRMAGLERDLADARITSTAPAAPAAVAVPAMPAPVITASVISSPAVAPVIAAPLMTAPETVAKPKGLSGARDGKADDLKLVKGIGPKLEILCNKLGFYHFDQIANWTAAEVAWVDENLEGFKGRVTRDQWVTQARDLAAGHAPRPGGEG